jgi:hypothetical protein
LHKDWQRGNHILHQAQTWCHQSQMLVIPLVIR